MPFKRRASLLSASNVPRRVCHEVSTNRLHAVEYRILRYDGVDDVETRQMLNHARHINSRARSLAAASRAMHTTPPRPTLSPSPSSTCKWKRGRPVTMTTGIGRQVYQSSSRRTPSLPSLPTSTDTMPLAGGRGQARRVGLWDPSQALRFAPLASVEAQHTLATSADAQTVRQPVIETLETSRTRLPGDHTTPIGSRTGVIEESQASAEKHIRPVKDHVPPSVAAPSGSKTVADSDVSSEVGTGLQHTGMHGHDERDVLAYQIPQEKLRAAMLAPPKTRASYWSAKLYEGPEGESLNTHYCKSLEVAERVAQYFLKEKVVGFDIEWKPWGSPTSIKQNASLIQLACEDRIALFHIALFPGTKVEQLMPPSLKAVLESPYILKVGVAVKGDFTRLEKYLGIQAQGVFELSRLHNLVEWYEVDPSKVSKKLVGLAAQVLQHLQLPLYKGEPLEDAPETASSVRESDWSLPLDFHQIHYAAADAYAGFRLYHMLEWKRTRLRPIPPPIPLCDYDNKPTPKSKVPRKRVKAAAKPNDADATDVNPIVETVKEEQEAEEGAHGYETAPEELIDSHQLEDPTSAAPPNISTDVADAAAEARVAENSESQKQQHMEHEATLAPERKRIGRVNLSWLKGADPGYPTLPKGSQEEVEEPSSTEQLDESEDEFVDAELEEALGRLDLDDAGALKEEHTSPSASTGYAESGVRESQEVRSVDVTEPNDTKLVELSDFHPTSLESDEVDESTAPISEPPVDLSEASPHPSEYIAATKWAQEYLRSTIPSPTSTTPSRIRATVPHLRAYYLWYQQKLPIEDIAPLLRDPPLPHSTVANYILQAISLERLEYENESLRSVMAVMPSGMRKGRWRAFAETVGALD
jgi:hypothetical protein